MRLTWRVIEPKKCLHSEKIKLRRFALQLSFSGEVGVMCK